MPTPPTVTSHTRVPPPNDRDLATLLEALKTNEAVARVFEVSVSTISSWKRHAKERDPGFRELATTGSIAAHHIRKRQTENAKDLAKTIAKIPLAASTKVLKYLETELADPKDAHAQAVFAAQYVPTVAGGTETTEATITALQMKIRKATSQ